ncbi:MAG: hypothetical protein AB1592_17270 [Pseudomonadota bacterium]
MQAHIDQLLYLGGSVQRKISDLRKEPPTIGYAPLSDEEWSEILKIVGKINLPISYADNVSNIRKCVDQLAIKSGHFSSLRYEMDRRVRFERRLKEYKRALVSLSDATASLVNLLQDARSGDPDLIISKQDYGYTIQGYHQVLEHINGAMEGINALRVLAAREIFNSPIRHNKSRKPTLENWATILIDFWRDELKQNVENRAILQDFICRCMSPYNQLSTRRQASLLIQDYISGDLCRLVVSATQIIEARIPKTPSPDDA